MSGYGADQYLQGRAEQSADSDAEQDMRAYLETFRCDYGDGMNVKGGQKNIELPGGNELTALTTEYIKLASSVKQRKEILDLKPGIESQEIVDKASGGLYDDVGGVRSDGALTSLSRALTDPDGPDAAAWRAQKAASQDKTNTGANMALGGTILGVAGNALVHAADSGKLKNIFSRNTAQPGQNSVVGAMAMGGNATKNGAGGNGLDGEIRRAQAACDTLRSDVSAQADNLYNDILTVQGDAQNAEIDTTAIEATIASADAAKTAIADAVSAADTALAATQKLTMPEMPECTAEKPDMPNKEDYKNEEPDEDGNEYDEDGYKSAQEEYKDNLKTYESELKECKKAEEAYDKDVKKVVADAKRHADEAERQLRLGRTELNRIQTALSNAQTAKTRGEDAKRAAAAREVEEKQKEEELQRLISEQASLATAAADSARDYYGAARDLADQVNTEIVLEESEAAAEEQITALKSMVDEDIEKAKTAMETAEKQIKTARDAGSVNDAAAAVAEAKRQAGIALERKKSIDGALQKIKDAKSAAKKKYDESQQDSEEGEENVEGTEE